MSYDRLMAYADQIRDAVIHARMSESAASTGRLVPYGEHVARQIAEREYGDLPDLFAPFATMPDPAAYDPLIARFAEVLGLLCTDADPRDPLDGATYLANPALDQVMAIDAIIGDWNGDVAQEFRTTFVDPFGTYTRNQFAITALLKAALEAEREIWVRARRDIEAIAHNTLAALDHLDSWSCTQSEWTMALTVFAAVLAIPTAGISEAVPAMAWAAVTSSAALVSALPPPVPAPELVFQGSTVIDVVAEMRAAITRFGQAILDQERKVADAMTHDHALVETNRRQLVAPRPRLADATRATVLVDLGTAG